MQLRDHHSFDNPLDTTRPVEHPRDASGTGRRAEAYDPAVRRFPYCVALLGVGGTPVRRCWAMGHNFCLRPLCPQVLQQRFGLLEVGRVKPFGEPIIDRGEQLPRFSALTLLLPQATQAHGRP
jgi:hypothetical protein